ncbi:MAG: carboxypeptidase regulatory-like domain-containing protein, partial [Phaeodactylibacter sp.]|nr:carboxypeptidase regulatory-like domain-containing protein [Phaeodactylibacter sp.]
GVAPFSYQWSTGETTASILPDVEGLYCATVTDAEGCESEACIYWGNVIDTFCSVIIYPIQGSTMLMADAEGSAPFAFLWNTGETTPQISINGPGDYCVVVTDANGCVSTACYSVATADNYLISGTVYEQDSSGLNGLIGEVYLIQYDPIEGTLTAIDTVALTPIQGGGYYNFGDVPAGDYLIKAALTPDSPGYDSNLPTYYGNVLWWDEAASVTVPYSGIQFFGITLASGDNPGGPGFIGGFVSDGANFQSGQIDFRDGDPISGVSIILLDELGQAVAYDYTDENGYFEFPSLEWGTYKVAIELLNQERAYYMVTIGPDNPSVNSLRFEVTEDGVVSTLDPALKESLILFPVPVQDVLGVQFESSVSGTALLFVSDYSGRVLLRQPVLLQQGQQRLELGVTRLPAGLYMLGIQSGSQLMGRKFIKQ